VLELRKSDYIKGFRKFIHQNNGATGQQFLSEITQAPWEMVCKSKPSASGEVMQRGF
jgi:hypothetical protein